MYEKVMVMAEIVWVRDLVLVLLSDDFGQTTFSEQWGASRNLW